MSDSYPTEPVPGDTDPARRVAEAAEGIAAVADGPLDEAVLRFDALHRELQSALADLDQG